MKIELPYGRSSVNFEIDRKRVMNVISPTAADPSPTPLQEIQKALENPIESPTIEALSPRGKKIAIVVDDMSRMTPTNTLLQSILRVLHNEGVKKQDVKIIIALGTHRAMTTQEMKDKCGSQIVERYEIINHSFRDETELEFVDYVAENIPVWINKEYVKSDLRIATGNIVPHYNAGWGAGAKILLPGLAGEETVGRMHVYSATTTPNGLGLDENPTRLLIDTFAKRVGIEFLVNTVTTKLGQIARVFAGDFVRAHRFGVAFARQIYGVRTSGLADITISSSYPADIDYWQGLKGLFSADLATKAGGGIIEVTPCPEGLSRMHPRWIDYLQFDTRQLKEMYKAGNVEDLVALGLALNIAYVKERHTVCIISDGISSKEAAKIGFQKFDNVDEALEYLSRRLDESKVNILTHGGETYPVVEQTPNV